MAAKVDVAKRNRDMVKDLREGVTPEGLSRKYGLTIDYMRELLRKTGEDHLLTKSKPRNRRKSRGNV